MSELTVTHNTPASFSSTTDMVLDADAMVQMSNLATMMAGGSATVPAHLQGNVADCMAVVMQAAQWRMNPFAVAQKTHIVSGTLGYEAQLVNAVICSSTKIVGGFKYEWFGDWNKIVGRFQTKTSSKGKQYQAPAWSYKDEQGLGIRVWATLAGESEPTELELMLTQAQVRNSTLWASDPKQQLAYLAVKRWARLYAPDVILGVYSADELEAPTIRDVNPASVHPKVQTQSQTLDAIVNYDDNAEDISSIALDFMTSMQDCIDIDELGVITKQISAAVSEGTLNDAERNALFTVYKARKAELAAIERDEIE